MLFVDFRNKLQALQRQLTDDNFKDTRRQLIDLQREMHEADLAPAERAELKHQIQQLFDQINILQEKDQEDFEREADENHAHLKERLFSCIDFVQENLDDHDAVWQKLLDLQDDFRGRRMRADERETLYAALQELFTIVKNRRQKAQQEFLARSEDTLSQWQDKVASLAKSAETANLDAVWQKLVDTSQQIRDSQMIPAHKKRFSMSWMRVLPLPGSGKKKNRKQTIRNQPKMHVSFSKNCNRLLSRSTTTPVFMKTGSYYWPSSRSFVTAGWKKATVRTSMPGCKCCLRR